MRSIYAKILLWCLGTLLLSMAGFALVSRFVINDMVGRNSFFERSNTVQLHEAIEAYESGGPQKLTTYFARMNEILSGNRHLIDARGRDVVTGQDYSALLGKLGSDWGVLRNTDGQFVSALASSDNRYRLLVFAESPFQMQKYVLYYLPILFVVGLWCWLLAYRIATPLRDLVLAVERFGSGDLSARVNSRRRDEIGELGKAFDRMAERIGTLLTSERRLLQDISHELRSPLARLSFAAELARTADDRDAAVARLKKEILRLTDLVGALLQSVQAEGEGSFSEENIRLDEVVNEVVGDCRVEADARGCQITFHGEPQVVPGDSELLRRAIENIVRNAIRYSPEKSTVEVKLDPANGSARVSVRDYGPGVPEDALPKIFQPFFRVDNSRNSSTGGVGLGLTIAHRAIALHHGRVEARNMSPGLMVTLEIPLSFYKN